MGFVPSLPSPSVLSKRTLSSHRSIIVRFFVCALFAGASYTYRLEFAHFAFDYSGTTISEATTTSKNAYAFLVAGCDPARPEAYRGYLYNILAAKYILSVRGSQNDVVVMVRMSHNSPSDSLPANEEEWLRSAGAVIKYLPRMKDERSESFYTAMLDKFEVLDLIEYKWVLFLDSGKCFCFILYAFFYAYYYSSSGFKIRVL